MVVCLSFPSLTFSPQDRRDDRTGLCRQLPTPSQSPEKGNVGSWGKNLGFGKKHPEFVFLKSPQKLRNSKSKYQYGNQPFDNAPTSVPRHRAPRIGRFKPRKMVWLSLNSFGMLLSIHFNIWNFKILLVGIQIC